MYETANVKRLNALFEELVPTSGKSDSLAGELVRATSRIGYRFFNDGDHIGVRYGKETCNPAARFLIKHGNKKVSAYVCALWGIDDEEVYEELLDLLVGAVADYIESHPDFRSAATDDMLDYRDPVEDRDDEEEEDEY